VENNKLTPLPKKMQFYGKYETITFCGTECSLFHYNVANM
jgi:hypothetical protein